VAGFPLDARRLIQCPNIVVAEADDASHFQILDFKYGLWGYKSLDAPFVRLLGCHYPGHDHNSKVAVRQIEHFGAAPLSSCKSQ
jgi:hypothetical protein